MAAALRPQHRTPWLRSSRFSLLALVLALTSAQIARAQQADPGDPSQQAPAADNTSSVPPSADPPSRVARLSVAQGSVSVEPASVNEFSPAELNDPLTTGDRIWADNGAEAELEAGQLAVRVGEATDLTVTAMTDTLAQFGLAQGSIHLRSFALDAGTTTEIDTPNVAVTVLQPGDVRVDVDPNGDTTIVTLLSGQVEVDGNGLQQTLQPGQRISLAGTNPVSAQWLQPAANDGLDSFSQDRDQFYQSAESSEDSYVNPDTVGSADLQQYGDWEPDTDYGEVWYPNNVAVGWQPYCYGHWTWIAPWGWTWIESEPWGFAPFHYGRWGQFGGRWGWIPGPPVVHPVYSPGLVVFVHPGNGITAWFPLGPREPYAPWYQASTLYLNRVNVSSIYSRDASQVRTIYNTANRPIYANPLGAQQHFANRSIATVAVPQSSFAAGGSIASARLHLSAAQLSAAAVLPHPMVSPERSMVAPGTARSVPPRINRPALATHQETGPRPGAPPESPTQATVHQGSGTQAQPAPIERHGANPPQSAYPPSTVQGGVRPPSPVHGTEQLPAANNGGENARQQPSNPAPPQGTLYNRAVPPPPRPSFDQQRQAIQNTDPGRPLETQQLNNLRENRPVGQPQQREPAPHPAPEPRSAPPAPRSSPPPPAPRSNNNRR
ncbi:MAG TPA: DUF6600 domain-containing protein [Acidobacteriaceae bacterium]|jgi:hypothetical protein|nr:DUF6600 domain-containing protein [Acidobacteriaceae bacterium]